LARARGSAPSMSFCKEKDAKRLPPHQRCGVQHDRKVMLSGREQNDDGDGRSIFHSRVETA
ncbi:hypothetical protein AOQ73_09085, partial [Bradyrhizobium pachyrhizi]|uniref:hypothetical protein n=1 Tax=Bradyrhizobium pachyrhizi TaxID=280333 RepID=UPI000704C16E